MELLYKGKKLGAPIYAKQFGSSGVTLGQLYEGSIIGLNEDNEPTEFYILEHNYEPELNGNGRTLLMRKGPYRDIPWDSFGKNIYSESTIDDVLNTEYKNRLDPNVAKLTEFTKFYYTPMGGDTNVSVLERSVFVLSLTENGFSNSNSNSEGVKIKSLEFINHPNTSPFWTRTSWTNRSDIAIYVQKSGPIANSTTISCECYPCFTLPSDFVVYD